MQTEVVQKSGRLFVCLRRSVEVEVRALQYIRSSVLGEPSDEERVRIGEANDPTADGLEPGQLVTTDGFDRGAEDHQSPAVAVDLVEKSATDPALHELLSRMGSGRVDESRADVRQPGRRRRLLTDPC